MSTEHKQQVDNTDPSLSSDLPIAFSGEVMLLGWSETSREGRTVRLRLTDEEESHPFRRMLTAAGKTPGQRFMAVFVMLDDDETPVHEAKDKPYSKHAHILHKRGWFFDRRVLAALGSPDDFRQWVSKQPCTICGLSGPSNVLKGPGYTGIPVCTAHMHSDPAALATKMQKLLKQWVQDRFSDISGMDGISNIMPTYFMSLCRELGIEETVPEDYLEG